jgi:hypothetical protein
VLGSLLPSLAINLGLNAQTAGWSNLPVKFNRPETSFASLLLCQVWALFASISPYNYTMHFEVDLTNGAKVMLRDLPREAAGKWEPILFHNEKKMILNLYSDPAGLRQYMEYLIWSNGIDHTWVARRTIYLRYWLVYPREQAAAAGTHYGPETTSVIDTY